MLVQMEERLERKLLYMSVQIGGASGERTTTLVKKGELQERGLRHWCRWGRGCRRKDCYIDTDQGSFKKMDYYVGADGGASGERTTTLVQIGELHNRGPLR